MKTMIISLGLGLVLTACSNIEIVETKAKAQSLLLDGRDIYLVGEMNDYEPNFKYVLRNQGQDSYCVKARLRAQEAPYRFKFADAKFSENYRFGFKMPPAEIYEGARLVALNRNARYEDLKFYPKSDGVYRFCLLKSKSEFFTYVQKVEV